VTRRRRGVRRIACLWRCLCENPLHVFRFVLPLLYFPRSDLPRIRRHFLSPLSFLFRSWKCQRRWSSGCTGGGIGRRVRRRGRGDCVGWGGGRMQHRHHRLFRVHVRLRRTRGYVCDLSMKYKFQVTSYRKMPHVVRDSTNCMGNSNIYIYIWYIYICIFQKRVLSCLIGCLFTIGDPLPKIGIPRICLCAKRENNHTTTHTRANDTINVSKSLMAEYIYIYVMYIYIHTQMSFPLQHTRLSFTPIL